MFVKRACLKTRRKNCKNDPTLSNSDLILFFLSKFLCSILEFLFSIYVIRWGCLEIHLTSLRCLGTSSGISTLINQGFCAQWVEDQSTPFLNFWV